MACTTAIYAPTLVINNIPIAYEPNSLNFDEGKGERKQSPQTNGTNSVSLVFSKDMSTVKGKVSFEVRSTGENLELKNGWENNECENVITITQDDVSRSFTQAAVVNSIEISTGVDSMMSVEFESLPATLG